MTDRTLAAALTQFRFDRRRFLAGTGLAVGSLAMPGLIGRAHAASVIKIGHQQPLTGPSAAYGIRARDGAQMAVDEINAAGGVADAKGNKFTFEVVVSDQGNDPKQAITLFRQAASDSGIMAALGPTNSVGFLPLIPVAQSMKLPLIGNGSAAPVKQWNEWSFRVNVVALQATPALLAAVTKIHSIKRLGVIYDQTQDAQKSDGDICKANEKLGYEVVAFEAFRANDQDFSPQISKIKAAKPDAVYVAAATGDGTRVVTQLRGAGLDVPLMTGSSSFTDAVYWDGTNGGVKDCYTWMGWDSASASGSAVDWVKKYNAAFKNEVTAFSAYGYDSIYALAEAVKVAGAADREKIQAALKSLKTTTPLGNTVTFKNPPDGENQTPVITLVKVTGRGTYEAVKA
jgi:branched-chain amino acid transport system substrate-binding protein